MELSPSTTALISQLESSAGAPLQRPGELGLLLEAGYLPGRGDQLEALSFHAKFVVRAFGIMQRIGRDGAGYDRLENEFGEGVERIRSMVHRLLEEMPEDEKERVAASCLDMTPSALENLLALCGDLSRYKNWLLDRQRRDT